MKVIQWQDFRLTPLGLWIQLVSLFRWLSLSRNVLPLPVSGTVPRVVFGPAFAPPPHLQDCFSRSWAPLLLFSIKSFECFLVARWGLEAICRTLSRAWEGPPSRGLCFSPVLRVFACEIFETRLIWTRVKGIIGSESPTRQLKCSERAVQGSRESCVFGYGEAKVKRVPCFGWLGVSWPHGPWEGPQCLALRT